MKLGSSLLAQGGELLKGLLKHLAQHATVDKKIDTDRVDEYQVEAYELAMLYAQWCASKQMNEYSSLGETEAALAVGFMGHTLQSLLSQLPSCAYRLGAPTTAILSFLQLREVHEFVSQTTNTAFSSLLLQTMNRHQSHGTYALDEEHGLMKDMFKTFVESKVKPLAESIHRHDWLIPEEIIEGVRKLDCFGLSIPAEYGGVQEHADNLGIVVVTEELSRGAMIVGSLVTRPDILSKALLKGGTEAQKQKWLPLLASGEKLCAIAVTEPNFGSNVAAMAVTAKPIADGWVLNGTKTWCTFAGKAEFLMVLARTETDVSLKHKGLSILIAEKPAFDGHDFEHQQGAGGRVSGRAIATIGYRGMHSYEVSFENYFVPAENLVGGEAGRGQGFYMQMAGFLEDASKPQLGLLA